MSKGKDPKPDPYLCLTDPDSDPRGSKTYGCGSGILVLVSLRKKIFNLVLRKKPNFVGKYMSSNPTAILGSNPASFGYGNLKRDRKTHC